MLSYTCVPFVCLCASKEKTRENHCENVCLLAFEFKHSLHFSRFKSHNETPHAIPPWHRYIHTTQLLFVPAMQKDRKFIRWRRLVLAMENAHKHKKMRQTLRHKKYGQRALTLLLEHCLLCTLSLTAFWFACFSFDVFRIFLTFMALFWFHQRLAIEIYLLVYQRMHVQIANYLFVVSKSLNNLWHYYFTCFCFGLFFIIFYLFQHFTLIKYVCAQPKNVVVNGRIYTLCVCMKRKNSIFTCRSNNCKFSACK